MASTITQAAKEIEKNFQSFRLALQNQQYVEGERLLAEQRALFLALPTEMPNRLALIEKAQELLRWSFTLVALHRVTCEQLLSTTCQQKQMGQGYWLAQELPGEALSVRG